MRDVIEIVVGFVRTLRQAGVSASPDRVHALVQALDHLDVTDVTDVYWAGRLTLCADPVDIARYDAAFATFFGGQLPTPGIGRPGNPPRVAQALPQTSASDAGGLSAEDLDALAVRASAQEVLKHRDVAALTAAQREELNRLFALISVRPAGRRTRRYRRAPRGRIDPGATVRRMLATAGEPGPFAYSRRRVRPRRVVFLLDVSGSMAPYADSLLRFAHAAVRAQPGRTEVFTLGTRLTRVTRELRQRVPDRALAAAGQAIPDWSGGTRLGEVLKAFLDRWGQRGVARGAIVVFASDGWERGDTTLLGAQMRRLDRLAYRIVWVNPHRGKDGFAPTTGGMQAALPYIDDLVAGHTFAALEDLARSLG